MRLGVKAYKMGIKFFLYDKHIVIETDVTKFSHN